MTSHHYLSTGCRHGEHAYCQGNTGYAGPKKPAVCKFCDAPCICPCHKTGGSHTAADTANVALPEDDEPVLTARRLTTLVPACDDGRHHAHPGEPCDEYEANCEAAQAAWDRMMARFPVTPLMQASEAPAALRGTAGPARDQDNEPLRLLAVQALGLESSIVQRVPHPYDTGEQPLIPSALADIFKAQEDADTAHIYAAQRAFAEHRVALLPITTTED